MKRGRKAGTVLSGGGSDDWCRAAKEPTRKMRSVRKAGGKRYEE
jgi:hypothetical protein